MPLRLLVFLAALSFGAALWVCGARSDIRMLGDQTGYQPVQPVAYSHALHAGKLKIDCLFCHTGAEKSKHAGIPPVSTCMKCHELVKTDSPEIKKLAAALDDGKPVEWVRIHRLPAFVQFNHSRHVNAQVKCQTCHGPVETLDPMRQFRSLNMGQCLDCHRKSAIALPHPEVARDALTDCGTCHY
jgi:hypothetical protein